MERYSGYNYENQFQPFDEPISYEAFYRKIIDIIDSGEYVIRGPFPYPIPMSTLVLSSHGAIPFVAVPVTDVGEPKEIETPSTSLVKPADFIQMYPAQALVQLSPQNAVIAAADAPGNFDIPVAEGMYPSIDRARNVNTWLDMIEQVLTQSWPGENIDKKDTASRIARDVFHGLSETETRKLIKQWEKLSTLGRYSYAYDWRKAGEIYSYLDDADIVNNRVFQERSVRLAKYKKPPVHSPAISKSMMALLIVSDTPFRPEYFDAVRNRDAVRSLATALELYAQLIMAKKIITGSELNSSQFQTLSPSSLYIMKLFLQGYSPRKIVDRLHIQGTAPRRYVKMVLNQASFSRKRNLYGVLPENLRKETRSRNSLPGFANDEQGAKKFKQALAHLEEFPVLGYILPPRTDELIKFMINYISAVEAGLQSGKLTAVLAEDMNYDISYGSNFVLRSIYLSDVIQCVVDMPESKRWDSEVVKALSYLKIVDFAKQFK